MKLHPINSIAVACISFLSLLSANAVTVVTLGSSPTWTWKIHTTTGTNVASFHVRGEVTGATVKSNSAPDGFTFKGGVDNSGSHPFYDYLWESDVNTVVEPDGTLTFSVTLSESRGQAHPIQIRYDFINSDGKHQYTSFEDPYTTNWVPIPEPGAFTLFASGIAVLVLTIGRQRPSSNCRQCFF